MKASKHFYIKEKVSMRDREDIEKDFRKKCSRKNKNGPLTKNLDAQKLLLETMLDVRDLLLDINLEDYPEFFECDCSELPKDAKVGITEEEILTMFSESGTDERKRKRKRKRKPR